MRHDFLCTPSPKFRPSLVHQICRLTWTVKKRIVGWITSCYRRLWLWQGRTTRKSLREKKHETWWKILLYKNEKNRMVTVQWGHRKMLTASVKNICKEKFSLISLNFRRTVDCLADLPSASLNDILFYLYSPCHTHIHVIVYNYHYSV